MWSESDAANGVIAIVDDDPHITDALRAWLDMLGVASISATSAESALNRIDLTSVGWGVRPAPGTAARPLLGAIIDINLSGTNGVELGRQLRQRQTSLSIVLISAIPSEELARNGALLPGVRCLSKPFDLDALALALFDGQTNGPRGRSSGVANRHAP